MKQSCVYLCLFWRSFAICLMIGDWLPVVFIFLFLYLIVAFHYDDDVDCSQFGNNLVLWSQCHQGALLSYLHLCKFVYLRNYKLWVIFVTLKYNFHLSPMYLGWPYWSWAPALMGSIPRVGTNNKLHCKALVTAHGNIWKTGITIKSKLVYE